MKPNNDLKKKVEEILEDEDTRDWIVTIGSEGAQINYRKHLAEYLIYRNLTIKQFIRSFEKNPKEEIKQLQQFVNRLLQRLSASSVGNYVSAIKSRMKYESIPFVREIRIPDRHIHHTIMKETTPTVNQIDNLIRNSKPSTQTIVALAAFLGLRFKAIAGLQIQDFPELKITENKEVVFEKIPTRIKIPSKLSKNRRGYETFLIENGCIILKNWLHIRLQSGEELVPESFIVPTGCKTESPRLKSVAIPRRLYTVFQKVNFNSRPYSLKGFFATQLMNSGIEQNLQTFFMGHSGPIQNQYTTQRQFSTDQIEIHRKIFKEKIQSHLLPQENQSDVKLKKTFDRFAKGMHVKTEDTATVDETIDKVTTELHNQVKETAERLNEERKKLSEEVEIKMKNLLKQNKTKIHSEQKIIPESELSNHLANGWRYQNTLPSGSLVIEQENFP